MNTHRAGAVKEDGTTKLIASGSALFCIEKAAEYSAKHGRQTVVEEHNKENDKWMKNN